MRDTFRWAAMMRACGRTTLLLRAGGNLTPWFSVPVLMASALPLPGQATVAMVADLVGAAAFEDGRPLGITSDIPALRAFTVARGGRLVLIRMATGDQFVFVGPCQVRFNAKGQPEGARPAEVKPLASLQKGLVPVKLQHLAQAGLIMREKSRPDTPRDIPRRVVEREPTLDDELEKLRPKADATFIERVVFATLVDRYGRRREARKLWKALAQERPGDATLRALAEESRSLVED